VAVADGEALTLAADEPVAERVGELLTVTDALAAGEADALGATVPLAVGEGVRDVDGVAELEAVVDDEAREPLELGEGEGDAVSEGDVQAAVPQLMRLKYICQSVVLSSSTYSEESSPAAASGTLSRPEMRPA
jgi:hypothetical protein